MAPQRAAADDSLSSSQWSAGSDARSDASLDASSSQHTTNTNPECPQAEITAKYNIIKAYLAKEKAPNEVQDGLEAIFSVTTRRVELPVYSQTIHDLQESIQKLNCRIDTLPTAPV